MRFSAKSWAFGVATALLVALCAVSGAQAFTIENQAGSAGGQGFKDTDTATVPDRHVPVSPFNTNNGQSTIRQGNTTLQFGGQRSFSDRYNTDNIFNPYTREGR